MPPYTDVVAIKQIQCKGNFPLWSIGFDLVFINNKIDDIIIWRRPYTVGLDVHM